MKNIINKMREVLTNNMSREYYEYSLVFDVHFLFPDYDNTRMKSRSNFNGVIDLSGIGENNELVLKYLIYKRVNDGLLESGTITIVYDIVRFIKKYNVGLLDMICHIDKLIMNLDDYNYTHSYSAIRVAFVELGHFVNTDLGFCTKLNRTNKKVFYYILKITHKHSLMLNQVQFMLDNIDEIELILSINSSAKIDKMIQSYKYAKESETILKCFFNMEE